MGHAHDGAAVFVEEALEPGDGLGIQVVGRFVEQQQVGLGQQQLAQRHPALFPARERVDRRVRRRAAQRVHGDFQRAVEVPAVG